MSVATQKRLAILGAVAAVALLVAANAHLVTSAVRSQPPCVAVDGAAAPARPAC